MNAEVNRFFKSLKAKITVSDEVFIRKYLNKQEQVIFYRQRIADQRHALDTAYYILREAETTDWLNKFKIIKTALLHDVGKAYIFMPVWIRPIAVLLKKYFPKLFNYISKRGSSNKASKFSKYFYVYEFHPLIGEGMLKEIGVEREILQLISMHHEPPMNSEPKELPLFRRADAMC